VISTAADIDDDGGGDANDDANVGRGEGKGGMCICVCARTKNLGGRREEVNERKMMTITHQKNP
jgi:hypothetical protein